MIEGLWTVSFQGTQAVGNGVMIFETERSFGGDSDFYYLGTYGIDRNRINAVVTVTQYGLKNFSVFGEVPLGGSFHLVIDGEIKDQKTIHARGHRRDNPKVSIHFLLVKRADLPG